MKIGKNLTLGLILSICSISSFASELTSDSAKRNVGDVKTVCGKVVEITKIGNDIFINLNKPHPMQEFYFYYPNGDSLNQNLLFKTVCATGRIERHKGKLQILINNKSQLKVK